MNLPPEHDWTYTAFDPGVTTGVSCWDEGCNNNTGLPVYVDQFNRDQLTEFLFKRLPKKNPKVFIYEGYKILPHKVKLHIGSEVPTIEVIGEILTAAKLLEIPKDKIIKQYATILPVAQAWSGKKLPKNHNASHWLSAYNHGYYWLHKQGLIKARVLDK